MSKVLYIQASPRKGRSKSIQAADAFIESYKQSHPDDSVEILDLFEADLPAFDGPAVQAKYTIMHGETHTAEQRKIWAQIEKVIEHFKAAEKYVFAVPMWNFGIPWRLKQYIDILVQPGYTFTVGENGYEGLVKGKPVVGIYARGGAYSEDPASAYDKQKPYLEQILQYIGFEMIHSIIVEPTLASGPETSEQAVQKAIGQAKELAKTF